jgi:hypothetical protein
VKPAAPAAPPFGPVAIRNGPAQKTASPVVTPAAATPAAVPSPNDDWRAKLHDAMRETGLNFPPMRSRKPRWRFVNNELQITAPKQFQLDLGRDEILTALKHLGFPALRFKVNFGETKSAPAPVQPAAAQDG